MAGHPNSFKWVRWVLLGAGLTMLATGATLWLMFQHIPSWYRPPAIAPAHHQRIRNDWAGKRDNLEQSLLHSEEPFDFPVTQDQLNAWLAIREAVWQPSREWLPAALSEPFVRIEKDGLRLAATYRSGGIRTILSAKLQVSAQPGGIGITLTSLTGGSLGIPASWVRERLAILDGRSWAAGQRSRYQLGGPPLPALSSLLDGAVFADTWIWEGPKVWDGPRLELPFQITGLRFEPGVLVITFRPLPR